MHQATAPELSTDGYFFSPLPFSNTDKIDALQLAIILGVNEDVDAEVILVARPQNDLSSEYKLAMVGRLCISDSQGNPINIDALRQKPIEELSEDQLLKNGWKVTSKPYFVWIRNSETLDGSRSSRIFSSAYNQLQTLQQLV